MNGESIRFWIYALYLIIIPALFYFTYALYALHEEKKARKARTSVDSKVVETLFRHINTFEPGFAENNEISINQVDKFLHYGLVDRGDGHYHINKSKHECLFRPLT